MAWFHPKTLLDKTYEIGIIIKGFDGTVELIGGFLILFLSPDSINGIIRFLTERSLRENPHGYFSNHIVKIGFDLTHGSHTFAALFLITHGLVKVVLVTCLLLNKMWAYPWALVALWGFLIYQIYLLATDPTFTMAFLFVLDAVIIYLVNREWKVQKGKSPAPSQM